MEWGNATKPGNLTFVFHKKCLGQCEVCMYLLLYILYFWCGFDSNLPIRINFTLDFKTNIYSFLANKAKVPEDLYAPNEEIKHREEEAQRTLYGSQRTQSKTSSRYVCIFQSVCCCVFCSKVCRFNISLFVFYLQGCTVGNITQVTVRDPSFPFGYDKTQFDLCLDVPVLTDNLMSICEKVVDNDLQKIILKKLNEVNCLFYVFKRHKSSFICLEWTSLILISFFIPGIPVWCSWFKGSGSRLSLSHGNSWGHIQVEHNKNWHAVSTHEKWRWIMGGSKGWITKTETPSCLFVKWT